VRHPWRRIAAWAVDCLAIAAWVGVTLLVGVPLYLAGLLRPSGFVLLNVVGALVVVIPVVLALAVLEHRLGATIGKRVLKLTVRREGRRPSFGRALVRNLLKVALPWLIGHAAVFAVSTDPTPLTSAALALAYVLPLVYVVSLVVGRGRTPYDAVVGTVVESEIVSTA
jgi:uncharacterized RDD family membrane protein YckC